MVTTSKPTKATQTWTMRAKVKNLLQLSANECAFDESANLFPNHSFKTEVLQYTSAVPLQTIEATVEPKNVRIAVNKESDIAGSIEIQPSAALPPGLFQCEVQLTPIGTAGDRLPAVILKVRGIAIQEVQAVPSELVFGPVSIGESLRGTILLRARSGREFSVAVEEADAGTQSVKKIDAQQTIYVVEQRAARLGRQTLPVVFRTTLPGNEHVEVCLPVTYIGIESGEEK